VKQGANFVQAGGRDRNVLGSWKEIAAYLGKGVRTVQRWEDDLGLPVRRPNGATKGVVYASPDELDRWLDLQWARRTTSIKADGPLKEFYSAIKASRELRHANQQLVDELLRNLQALRDQCAALVQASGQTRETRKLLRQRGEGSMERSKTR
jgi:hypothetical protein